MIVITTFFSSIYRKLTLESRESNNNNLNSITMQLLFNQNMGIIKTIKM